MHVWAHMISCHICVHLIYKCKFILMYCNIWNVFRFTQDLLNYMICTIWRTWINIFVIFYIFLSLVSCLNYSRAKASRQTGSCRYNYVKISFSKIYFCQSLVFWREKYVTAARPWFYFYGTYLLIWWVIINKDFKLFGHWHYNGVLSNSAINWCVINNIIIKKSCLSYANLKIMFQLKK